MAEKSLIPGLGIVFDYNTNWMGGTYYILNLLHAISALPANEQPPVVIYGNDPAGFEAIKKEVTLQNLSYSKSSVLFSNRAKRAVNFVSRRIWGSNFFNNTPRNFNEVIFPNPRGLFFQRAPHKVFWIPDFQEKYYPGFFSTEDLDFRESFIQDMIAQNLPVVFSSRDAENDFKRFYPDAKNRVYVLPFAVTVPDHISSDFQQLKKQYNLLHPYFITPNQFWVHKNHGIIIEAAALLKEKGIEFSVLFPGKDHDPRCPEYSDELKKMIATHDLTDTVKFLGFLDRDVLLCLIKNASAVIQPSLFEGWSTVVEDAKALNKPVIASSLNVHKEQMGDKGNYFDPKNAPELADEMLRQLERGSNFCDWGYRDRKKEFATGFMDMIKDVVR